MNAVIALIAGVVWYALSAALEQDHNLPLWQHADTLLLVYWVLFVVVLERAARFAWEGLAAAPAERRKRLVESGGVYLVFALPIVFRGAYLLWHFHARTGSAEGMGWIPLTYPAGLVLALVTALLFAGDLARGTPGRTQLVARMGLLAVQHIPHVALWLQLVPPFGPRVPDPLVRASSHLIALSPFATAATLVHVVLLGVWRSLARGAK